MPVPCTLHLLSAPACPSPSVALPEINHTPRLRVESEESHSTQDQLYLPSVSQRAAAPELGGETAGKALFPLATKDAFPAGQVTQTHLNTY